jgi:hypothetical protein
MDDHPGTITRFLQWLWRDGPVWIVVGGILFLILINVPHMGGAGGGR